MLHNKNKKINAKLCEIGQILNMDNTDVIKSKRTIRNIACICIAAGILSVVGMFVIARQDPVGLWYIPPSVKDFSFFRGLF